MAVEATSVELTFDDQLSAEIKRVWDEMVSQHVQYQHHTTDSLPHITISVREKSDEDWTPSFRTLASRLKPFLLTFSSIGVFLRPIGLRYTDAIDKSASHQILYLSPKPTIDLCEAQCLAQRILPGWNTANWHHYSNELWVPHCTLAEHLETRDLLKAITICQNQLKGPIRGWVRGVRLVDFPPPQVIDAQSLSQ